MPDTNITEFDVSRRRFLTGAGGLTFAVALGTGTVTLLNTAHARARPIGLGAHCTG